MYGMKIKVFRINNLLLFAIDGENQPIAGGTRSGEKLPTWATPTLDAALLPYGTGRIAFDTNGTIWTSTDLPAQLLHGYGVGYTTNAMS
jgi:hypothetical protein